VVDVEFQGSIASVTKERFVSRVSYGGRWSGHDYNTVLQGPRGRGRRGWEVEPWGVGEEGMGDEVIPNLRLRNLVTIRRCRSLKERIIPISISDNPGNLVGVL